MSGSGRTYENGAAKRKKASEKGEREENVLKKTAKLDTFFTKSRIIQPDNAVPIVESQSHSQANNNIDTLLHADVVVAVKQINNQTEEEHQ